MAETERVSNLPPPLVALAGWFVPGAGYMLIGDRARGVVVLIGIVTMYILGLLIGGVRVIEVPGYDSQTGMQIRMRDGRWALTGGGFLSEIANKPWFAGQILAGPICLGSSAISVSKAQEGHENERNHPDRPRYPRPHGSSETVATLYTAIAGMLNLMVMIDAAHRAGQPREAQE